MTVRISNALLGALLCALYVATAVAEPPKPAPVQTTSLAKHDMTETVSAYGRVEPAPDQLIAVSLPRAGTIQHVWVSPGERIEAGQRLLEVAIAPDERMSFEQARAAVRFAQGKLARQRRLFQQRLATRDDVDAARQSLADARATLDAFERRGAERQSQLVRAPVAGIVTRVTINQGERVRAETGALLLATGRALIVPLGVEPEDARRIAPGTKVSLTSPFQPSVRAQTTVSAVHAMVNPTTRLVDVIVSVPDDATFGLVLGSVIEGDIVLATHHAFAVPRRAVLTDAKGAYLFVVEGGRARRVDVTTGISAGGLLEVSAPTLSAGQAVVTLGNYEIEDGSAVRESRP
ncbi:MAG: efflux RND transporter periplasmic adaptor subunit [Myxococcales bacterium]|nr:efflux RND transporter periplasmic adaptor subunit [Myxococcales bacterium]